MKKTFILIIMIIILTGCNETKKNNKIEKNLLNDITLNADDASYICTIKNNNKEYNLAGKYAIYLDENENVVRVESSEIIETDDYDKLNQLQSYYNSNYKNVANYGGYTYDIYQENDRLICNVIIDYTMINVESYITDNPNNTEFFNEDYKITKDKILEFYSNNHIECQKK